jgi:hypothetical protein
MTNSSFLKRTIFALFVLTAVLFVSCDDDFNLLGADVVGDDIHSDMIKETVEVVAYDRATGAVQSNNMTENKLGIFENPVFGKTVAHFVTQIEMASANPTLYFPEVDSVYIYIPYYSTATDVDDDGETTVYELDTTYLKGDANAKFDLKIFRNGYFLRDSDPGASDNVQRYYSDDKAMVESLVVGEPLVDSTDFSFSAKEIPIKAKVTHDGVESIKIVERKAPGIFAYLDPALMEQVFLSDANKGNLLNNTIFKNYFRGLYFQVTQKSGAAINTPRFSEGTITVKFHDRESKTTGGVAGPDMDKDPISKTITFNLKGNTINFFENSYNQAFTNAVTTSDAVNGDSQLYVKGGEGSMAVLDIDAAKLMELKASLGSNVLINEANIVFYTKNADVNKPLRLYLYDLKNRKPIIDYSMDGTSVLSNSKLNKYTYDGIKSDSADYGKYRIRVTNHIKNIIKGDSTSVKLGLVVTDNINVAANYRLKTPFTEGDTEVKDIPYSSVQSLFGTLLYGSNIPDGEDQRKRVKLEIFYTKPKE